MSNVEVMTHQAEQSIKRRGAVNAVYRNMMVPYLHTFQLWYRTNHEGETVEVQLKPNTRAVIRRDFHGVFSIHMIRSDGQAAIFEQRPQRGGRFSDEAYVFNLSIPGEVMNKAPTKRNLMSKGQWFNEFIHLYVKLFVLEERSLPEGAYLPHMKCYR